MGKYATRIKKLDHRILSFKMLLVHRTDLCKGFYNRMLDTFLSLMQLKPRESG